MRNIGRSDTANQIGPKPDFITPNFYRLVKVAAETMRQTISILNTVVFVLLFIFRLEYFIVSGCCCHVTSPQMPELPPAGGKLMTGKRALDVDLMLSLLISDEGPYTKHSAGSRTPDGALAIRRQSIPGDLPVPSSDLRSEP